MVKEKVEEKQYNDKVFLKTKNEGIWETAPHAAFLPFMFAGIGGFFAFMILGFVALFVIDSKIFMYFSIALGVLFLIIVGVVIPVKKNNENNISKSIGFIKRDNKWYAIKLMYDHNSAGVVLNAPSGTLLQVATLPHNINVASKIQDNEEYIRQARLIADNYSKALDGVLKSLKTQDYFEPVYAKADAKVDYILNKSNKNEIIYMHNLFTDFVNLLYGYNNDKEIESLTLKQKFYIFYEEHKKELDKFSSNYLHYGSFNFEYSQVYADDLKHKNTAELIKKIKKLDSSGNKISSDNGILTQNIYTVFYISLYNLVINNNELIRQCKNCHRYFLTTKSNTFFCDNIYYEGKTCKEVGNQLQQKQKEDENPVYGKYRKKFANKATLLKRNPDIYSKEDYDNWKKEAQQYIQNIKKGIQTEEEFDKWLDKK